MTTWSEVELDYDLSLQPDLARLRTASAGKWVMDDNGVWVLRPYTLVRANGRLSEIPASTGREEDK